MKYQPLEFDKFAKLAFNDTAMNVPPLIHHVWAIRKQELLC